MSKTTKILVISGSIGLLLGIAGQVFTGIINQSVWDIASGLLLFTVYGLIIGLIIVLVSKLFSKKV